MPVHRSQGVDMHRRHQLGKRRIILSSLAAYNITRAYAYVPSFRTTPVQDPIMAASGNSIIGLYTYLCLWAGVALLCLWDVRTGRIRRGLILSGGLMAAWGAAWYWGWLHNPSSMWYQTSFTYWCPAVVFSTVAAMLPDLPETTPREA